MERIGQNEIKYHKKQISLMTCIWKQVIINCGANFEKMCLEDLMKNKMVNIIVLNLAFLLLMGCGKKITEKEYFELASQNMVEENWSEAEKNFQNVIDKYPEGEYASKALFMVGFINANYLKNYEKARKYYTEFIEKYPNHDLTDDAQYEVDNLGKNIDDLPLFKEEGAESDSVTAEVPSRNFFSK
jgi:tetratricopeptide (TPR) repeat protein